MSFIIYGEEDIATLDRCLIEIIILRYNIYFDVL